MALLVAMDAAQSFLAKHELDITLYLFGNQAYAAGKHLMETVDAYIDEHYVDKHLLEAYTTRKSAS